jgi:hypothetical protein
LERIEQLSFFESRSNLIQHDGSDNCHDCSTLPNIVVDSKSQSTTTNEGQRFPLTGTIDQASNDIQRIKQKGIDHIIFGYNFISRPIHWEKLSVWICQVTAQQIRPRHYFGLILPRRFYPLN